MNPPLRFQHLATALVLGLLAPLLHADSEFRRPNILFIFADDWGFGDLGCHGNKVLETPNLDRLASQGSDFHQFTVASGVCSPSRTALLTGQFPARYCINQHFASVRHHVNAGMPDWLHPEVPMLPRFLKQAGYRTYHFGKWHLTNYDVPDAPDPTAYGYDKFAIWGGSALSAKPHEIFDLAIGAIKESGDKPFFINLWIHETHTPHYPKQELLDHYAGQGLDERERVYPAVVTHADREIGRVLKALDEAGLTEDTLVIFSSDNGPEYTIDRKQKMGHPELGPGLTTWYSRGSTGGLKGAKRSLHEGGVRVPLIVRWPGKVKAGGIDKTSVITGVDWLPTLCKIAGADLPADYVGDGEDRSAVLFGLPGERSKAVHWYWPAGHGGNNWPLAAIRSGKWKLLLSEDRQRIELYDIPADRAETNNLAAQRPELVGKLRAQVEAWLDELPEQPDPACFSKLRKK